jgi:hypothetical protein
MILSCKEAASLVSQSLDKALTLRQRLALGLHLLMCRFCSRYQRQTLFIRSAMRRIDSSAAPDLGLSPDAKERIRRALGQRIDSE